MSKGKAYATLKRRESPYSAASGQSFRVAWDWHRREPEDLREAVRMVRRAYADEIPTKLHEGPGAIGPGGTPRMAARAEGYILGRHDSDDAVRDAETGERDLVGYYHTPFRALLESWDSGSETERKRAAIVSHVTIGSQGPQAAAMSEGVPGWCAKFVAEDALRTFLRNLTDMRLHLPRPEPLPEGVTAA